MALPRRFIKARLIEKGVTHASIAQQCGVDESLVSHVLARRRRHACVERAIAEAIGVPVDEVFTPRQQQVA